MRSYPKALSSLIESLKRLPGVGNKTAERFAFALLDWPKEHLENFSKVIQEVPFLLHRCEECGFLLDGSHCVFCTDHRRDSHLLCVVGSSKDAFAIEKTHEFLGLYHVLPALFSLEKPVQDLGIEKLKERIQKHAVTEVILGLDATLEGDATSLYLKQALHSLPCTISRLAFGLPLGSSLEYVDGGTLAKAFLGRAHF